MGDSAHEILHHRTSRKKRCKHNIEDIFDGELYRNHFDPKGYFHGTSTAARGKEIHLSLMVNTDGVSIFRSSNYSLWPVYFVINELPPENRYQFFFNPLTLMSDQDRISPYNIHPMSTRRVIRIKKKYQFGVISRYNTTFSELTLQELYGWQLGELQI